MKFCGHSPINASFRSTGSEIFPTVSKCRTEKDSECFFLEGSSRSFDNEIDVTIDFNGCDGESEKGPQTPTVSTVLAEPSNKPSITSMSSNQTFVGKKASMSSDKSSLPSQKLKSSSESVTSGTNKSKTKKGSNSKEFEVIQPLSEELGMSLNVTASESILQDDPVEQINLIQFYADPLNELSESIAFGFVPY